MKDETLLRMMRYLAAKGRLRIELNDAGEGVALADLLKLHGVSFTRTLAGSARTQQERSSCARRENL